MTESKSTFSDALLGADADRALSALDEAGDQAVALVDAWLNVNRKQSQRGCLMMSGGN